MMMVHQGDGIGNVVAGCVDNGGGDVEVHRSVKILVRGEIKRHVLPVRQERKCGRAERGVSSYET